MKHRLRVQGLLVAAAAAISLGFAATASADNYVVLYKQQAVPSSAACICAGSRSAG